MSRFTALKAAAQRLLVRRPRRISFLAQGLLLLLILAGTQEHLQSIRWWWSPTVVAALGITSEQAAAIERAYEDSLPAQRHASEEVIDATARVADLIRAQVYDDQLLHLTERLAQAHSTQSELHRKLLERAARALTPEQRRMLGRLDARKRVVDW